MLFLKLLVAGHMTIYVTRVRDWFWRRPWPSATLFIALESTQVLGTLAAVFGWLVMPIPWWLAAGMWGYAIVWMFLLSAVRVFAFRRLRPKLVAGCRGTPMALWRAAPGSIRAMASGVQSACDRPRQSPAVRRVAGRRCG